jgi:hypothetical protein
MVLFFTNQIEKTNVVYMVYTENKGLLKIMVSTMTQTYEIILRF